MIERFIYDILQQRIAALAASRRLFRKTMSELGVESNDEINLVFDRFSANPPRVQHAYPRKDITPPIYAIILGRRRKAMQFIGEHGHAATADEARVLGSERFEDTDVVSSIMAHNLKLWTVTDDPTYTIHYEGLLSAMLDAATEEMTAFGLSDFTTTAGDISPMETYLPHHLFVRETIFECQVEFNVFGEEGRSLPRGVDVFSEDVGGGVRGAIVDDPPISGAEDLVIDDDE